MLIPQINSKIHLYTLNYFNLFSHVGNEVAKKRPFKLVIYQKKHAIK